MSGWGITAGWHGHLSQVRYAAAEISPAKSARARGSYLRTSFKNTRETAQAINGWKLERALAFLENVKEKKEAVPMRRFAGSTGRTAQGMKFLVQRRLDLKNITPMSEEAERLLKWQRL